MLGALSVLHSSLKITSGAASSYNKRLVFLALAGEPWGYMGSRRLLYEAADGSNNTAGLDLSLIEKVSAVLQYFDHLWLSAVIEVWPYHTYMRFATLLYHAATEAG